MALGSIFSRDISKSALVSRIMDRFDRNGDGVVSYAGKKDSYFVRDLPESVVAHRERVVGPNTRFYQEDRLDLSPLFRAADKTNSGEVSAEQLDRFLTAYSTGDRIGGRQLAQLKRDFPEQKSSSTFRDIKDDPFSPLIWEYRKKGLDSNPGSDSLDVRAAKSVYKA